MPPFILPSSRALLELRETGRIRRLRSSLGNNHGLTEPPDPDQEEIESKKQEKAACHVIHAQCVFHDRHITHDRLDRL